MSAGRPISAAGMRELEDLRNRVASDLQQREDDRERQRNDQPTITVRGVAISTPRINEDPDVPIVACEVVDASTSFLPPILASADASPSQQIAKALNDKRLEPCIWLSLADSVAERPAEPGWYVGLSSDEDYDSTVNWSRLGQQEVIDSAFEDGGSSLMVYGARKDTDLKIDFAKSYVKYRSGMRRPLIHIPSPLSAPRDFVWEYNYGENTEFRQFDNTDSAFIERVLNLGRNTSVLYDGGSCISIDISKGTWVNVLYDCGCDVEESKGEIRRVEGAEYCERVVSEATPPAVATTVATTAVTTAAATVVSVPSMDTTRQHELANKLMEMGFAEDVSLQALFDTGFDLDRSLEKLLINC
jgi:hypothetical protein